VSNAISDFKQSIQSGREAVRPYRWPAAVVAAATILVRAYLRDGILFPVIFGAIVAVFLFLDWYHRKS
jgi:hypothetical protein